jgi:hypothetical protein
VFINVERKVKPKENPFEYKKRIVLDQEKSKQSLGEIYEQEYLKQQQVLYHLYHGENKLIFKEMMDFWCLSWRPVLVVEEAGVPGENHRPWARNW